MQSTLPLPHRCAPNGWLPFTKGINNSLRLSPQKQNMERSVEVSRIDFPILDAMSFMRSASAWTHVGTLDPEETQKTVRILRCLTIRCQVRAPATREGNYVRGWQRTPISRSYDGRACAQCRILGIASTPNWLLFIYIFIEVELKWF